MRRIIVTVAIALCSIQAFGGALEDFLGKLNVQARADLNGFSAKVSSQFQVGAAQVKVVLGSVQDPADAFMVFQLGHMTGRPTEDVLRVYENRKGRGWGELAKELGIKPGSAQFHALKNGQLRLSGVPEELPKKGKAKGKGKGQP